MRTHLIHLWYDDDKESRIQFSLSHEVLRQGHQCWTWASILRQDPEYTQGEGFGVRWERPQQVKKFGVIRTQGLDQGYNEAFERLLNGGICLAVSVEDPKFESRRS